MDDDPVEKLFEIDIIEHYGASIRNIQNESTKWEQFETALNVNDDDWLEWADGLSGTDNYSLKEEKDEAITSISGSIAYFGLQYDYYIGVSIDTEKVTAAIIDDNGVILNQCEVDFFTWNPLPGYKEQSSDEIWEKIIAVIRDVKTNFDATDIKGIAFIATSSLVALDENGESISVSPTLDQQHNVILWTDKRATEEAKFINSVDGAPKLFTSKRISSNSPLAKLLWLKNNLRNLWNEYSYFFFLSDFCTWKLTRSEIRSPSTLFYKWNFMMDHKGNVALPEKYFKDINLEDISYHKWNIIGQEMLESGSKIPIPVLPEVAQSLFLDSSISVAVGMNINKAQILNLIGITYPGISRHPTDRLFITYGSTLSIVALSRMPLYVPNFVGPWFSIILPGLWMNEGHQKCGDRFIQYILNAYSALISFQENNSLRSTIHEHLENVLIHESKKKNVPMTYLTKSLNILPEFNGNSSPLNDFTLNGTICGLTFANKEVSISVLYLAALQAFAYSTLLNLNTLISRGFTNISVVAVNGSEFLVNSLQQQTLADVLGLPIIIPEKENLCLSAAVLAANAASNSDKSCLSARARHMFGSAKVIRPRPQFKSYHEKRFKIYLEMIEDQKEYRKLME